jgi:TRAP transporter TAXI family solute receptor
MRPILIALSLLFGFAAPSRAAETLVTILTGPTTAVYYTLGLALSSVYGHAMPGADITVQSTGGPAENLRLLEAGDGEFAFTFADTLANAWAGNKEAGFSAPFTALRSVGMLYPGYIEIVARKESGIRTLADLEGKRVSVGTELSGTAFHVASVLRGAGMSFRDLAEVDHSPFGNSVRMVERGELDATEVTGGLGVEAVRHLLATGGTLVPIPPAVVAKIGDPTYQAASIPAGTFPGQTADIPGVAIMNLLVTRAAISDEMVYLMTKSLFDHLDQLVATHPAAKDIDVKKAATGLPVPLHPGAERYYREVGIIK